IQSGKARAADAVTSLRRDSCRPRPSPWPLATTVLPVLAIHALKSDMVDRAPAHDQATGTHRPGGLYRHLASPMRNSQHSRDESGFVPSVVARQKGDDGMASAEATNGRKPRTAVRIEYCTS